MKFSLLKTEFGQVLTFKQKKLLRFPNYLRMVRFIFARLKFESDKAFLASHGVAVPEDAFLAWTGKYQVEMVPVSRLKCRFFFHPDPMPIAESPHVKYMRTGDEKIIDEMVEKYIEYGRYTREHASYWKKIQMDTFESLKRMDYKPEISCILVDEDYLIDDGCHRASAIYAMHGPDQTVQVIRMFNHDKQARFGKWF